MKLLTLVDGALTTVDSETLVEGLQGPTGPIGKPGPAGRIGERGRPGERGPQGPQGPTGQQGQIGAQGNPGLQGVRGDLGMQGPRGEIGPPGPPGPAGVPGPKGEPGATGADGKDGKSFVWRGEWKFDQSYALNEVVAFGGSSFISVVEFNLANEPDPLRATPFWDRVAVKGDRGEPASQGGWAPTGGGGGGKGPKGDKGDQGDPGPAGADGEPGADGATGPAGADGATGPAGADGAIGPAGADGADGSPGADGPQGAYGGGSVIEYAFDTATAHATPTNGTFRLDNATEENSAHAWVSILDRDGNNVTAILSAFGASTSAIKGYLRLVKESDPTAWIIFSVSSSALDSPHYDIGVTYVAKSGTNPFLNGDIVLMEFTRTGDKGDVGADGPQGDPGAAGATGATGATGPQYTSPPQGRLTLTTLTPILTTDTLAKSTVYYTPYCGCTCPVFDGSSVWTQMAFTELSQTTSDNTKSPAAVPLADALSDYFFWNDAGTPRATRGPTWSTLNGRGTGAGTTELVLQDGIWVNANAITHGPGAKQGTYLGTLRTDSSRQSSMMFNPAGASGGTLNRLDLFNAYNRVEMSSNNFDSADSWTYTTATLRAKNAGATGSGLNNSTLVTIGLPGVFVDAHNYMAATNSSSDVDKGVSIGVDSTTTTATGVTIPREQGNGAGKVVPVEAHMYAPLAIGLRTIQALEWSAATGTTTWYGDNGGAANCASKLVVSVTM